MIQFYIPKEHMSPRVSYVIDFLGRVLGYNYNAINDKKKINKNNLLITYSDKPNQSTYKSQSVINIFNAQQIDKLSETERKINLFEWDKVSIPMIGRNFSDVKPKEWTENKSNKYFSKTGCEVWQTRFDIFTNIFYHVSRYEEKWRHFTEETATDYSTSLLSRYHELKIPIVDILISYLDNLIRKKLENYSYPVIRVLPWPKGEDLGVAITHDVDLTRGPGIRERLLQTGKILLKQVLKDKEEVEQLKSNVERQDDQAWGFPELLDFYKEKKWKATFFFLSRMLEGIHYRYNISSKKFVKLFEELKSENHEIGLHTSLMAFEKPGSYSSERRKLESVSSVKLKGMRQHYLRAKFPRLWKLAENSQFEYDSSLGYNYQAGFRAGTCHPFYTYDHADDLPLSLVEFSLAFFEHNLPQQEESISNAKDTITELIKQASKYHGLLVALFHPSNFLKDPYHKLWEFFIQKLEKNKIYVDSLVGHLHWMKLRDKIKFEVIDDKKTSIEISIQKPAEIEKFAIELMGKEKIITEKGIKSVQIRPGSYRIETKRKKFNISVEPKNK